MDVDVERGVVRLDKNKTDDPRAWALDPGVARAVRAYVEARGAEPGDFLFVDEAAPGSKTTSWLSSSGPT